MRHRYILFYKPYGVLSQFSGEAHTLKDHIQVKSIYPVGRLDRDSEGLLLLTDDGEIQHMLSDPRYEHPRTYWVQVENIPGRGALRNLKEGVTIQGRKTRPAQVRLLPYEPELPPRNPPVRYRKTVPTAWLEMTLREGRNRQVRRMTAAAGHPTLRLLRTAIGALRIDGLKPGEWRDVTPRERAYLESLRKK